MLQDDFISNKHSCLLGSNYKNTGWSHDSDVITPFLCSLSWCAYIPLSQIQFSAAIEDNLRE